jgi:hypothetical protein
MYPHGYASLVFLSVLVLPLEFSLQAPPHCRGTPDSKTADAPLGGERPLCYLHSVITYKFDVRLPFAR